MYVSHVCAGACEGQETGLDTLELLLQAVVVNCVAGVLGTALLLWKSGTCPNC